MSDEKALLAAIWEHPHEDTPRLVYADWLQETGEPANVARAEFIRVQCELALLDEWDEGYAALLAREKELLRKWSEKWRKRHPKGRRLCKFHRGFPKFDLAMFEIDDLLKLTVKQLEDAPLSRYHYNIEGPHLNAMLKWPGLRFQELFSPRPPRLPKGWVEQVAACENLRNVSELCTIDCKITPDDIKTLLDAWIDRHLPSLGLATNIGDDGAAVLASHPTVAKVRELDLRQPGLTAAGIRALTHSPHLTQVKTLDLSGSPCKAEGIEELVRWPHLSGMRTLCLHGIKMGVAGVEALAACPALSELRYLYLGNCRLGVAACRALATSPYLTRLRTLNLYGNPGVENPQVESELRARFGKAVSW
jgi:uncharacterized protein (TIGR02996 family)